MVFAYSKNAEGHFICQHCDYTAKNQSTMHYHLKKHDGALPHPCKHCGARFLQKGLLDLHIRSRHSETLEKKDTYKCPCSGCSYEDIRKGNCLIHFVRVHMKELTEKLKTKATESEMIASCSKCSKNFKSMTQFYYHASQCVEVPEKHECYLNWKSLKA
jgi:hypothetical protein